MSHLAASPRSISSLRRTLDLVACLACGGTSEVTGTFDMPGSTGTDRYLRSRCLDGHLVVAPAMAYERAAA